jgi:hypothetical protein
MFTRPTFDAACAALTGTPDALTPSQCHALWCALVPAVAQHAAGRYRWTPAATLLRVPLLREQHTVREQLRRRQFNDRTLALPGKPVVDISQLHSHYASRINEILLRLDSALQREGHWCLPDKLADAQPLRVVVANERAAGRCAGTLSWVQWEDPDIVRRIGAIFAAYAEHNSKTGPMWQPYATNGRKRGAAAELKMMREWRGAFHDAMHSIQADAAPYPDAVRPLLAFQEELKSSLAQQAIEEAIREQCAARRGPRNPAFKDSIWHALNVNVRTYLAQKYHDALVARFDYLCGCNQRALAAQYNPRIMFNPWALTAAELDSLGVSPPHHAQH